MSPGVRRADAADPVSTAAWSGRVHGGRRGVPRARKDPGPGCPCYPVGYPNGIWHPGIALPARSDPGPVYGKRAAREGLPL